MSTLLEQALAELDQATDTLLGADTSNILVVCSALEKRADAITKIAFLVEEAGRHDPTVLERLAAALARGDQATRRVLNMKQDAIEEWGRLTRLQRNLGDTTRHELNLSA